MVADDYQIRVIRWAFACLGAEATDLTKCSHRFIEEAIELVQAADIPKDQVLRIVDYVYSRDVGKLSQEVGGVAVTLTRLCESNGISLNTAAEVELARCREKIDEIRKKNKRKPDFIR